MSIIKCKPTTPGRRGMSFLVHDKITRQVSEESLSVSKKRSDGRNNQGKRTVGHRGGGAKRRYRIIDFNGRDKLNIPAIVKEIEYDPNRNVYIALLFYNDGEKRYVLLANKIKIGFKLISAEKTVAKPGNRMLIKNIPEGIDIYNIELVPGRGGKLVRSAGMSAKLASLEGEYAQVKLPSGEIRLINKECMASVGTLCNAESSNVKIGKAGRARHMGRRPHVRGSAMNPVDHPHGGGEGCCPIGLKYPKTRTGKCALGRKTRNRKFTSRFIVKSRRAK
ncbi:MAG: 50S ribosomal protein L2 [Candidatus Gracilibacteria bacterium]|nr:50S ribosomal protein L2 [Candidatus Gracilibacteria bacterium]